MGFPSFIIPKKDGRVRWLSDFQKLNDLIIRKPFPLPKDYCKETIQKYETKYNITLKKENIPMPFDSKPKTDTSEILDEAEHKTLPMASHLRTD